jgi:SAM-dependent methyltransferase
MKAGASTARGQFAGVLQIVRYNWTLYVAALAGTIVVIGIVNLVHPIAIIAWLLMLGAAAGLGWLVLSLVVSHYIYDRSALYRWDWIREQVGGHPRHIVNIHAGLDETSEALQRLFPAGELSVLDIYDKVAMPEPSIARARNEARPDAIEADFRSLPLQSQSADLVTLIFTAHELRQPADRDAFFSDVARILTPTGVLLLVEHLRDSWNFAAFGPGAFHFWPRSEWLRTCGQAGLALRSELRRTPFVRALLFGRETGRQTEG